MPVETVLVPPDLAGKRLDVALATLLPSLTRSAAQKLIEAGRVQLAYGKVRAAYTVSSGERLTVTLDEVVPAALPVATSRALDLVYADDDLFIINKPAGLAVHPSVGHTSDTLVNALLSYDPSIASAGDPERPGIVHRLDKDTSGLIAVARTPQAHAALAAQWRERSVVKRYRALVIGHPRQPEGIIDYPIGRDPRHRQRMAVVADGRSARTIYRTTDDYRGFALLDVTIETGRTHQIRVHLAALGHPVAGDTLYGARQSPPGLKRQFLHSYLLGLRLPSTGEYREFSTPLPDDLHAVLDALAEN